MQGMPYCDHRQRAGAGGGDEPVGQDPGAILDAGRTEEFGQVPQAPRILGAGCASRFVVNLLEGGAGAENGELLTDDGSSALGLQTRPREVLFAADGLGELLEVGAEKG